MAARHRRGSSASSCTTMRLMICLAACTTASEMVKHKPKPLGPTRPIDPTMWYSERAA